MTVSDPQAIPQLNIRNTLCATLMDKLWTTEKKVELQGVLLRNIDRGKSLKERLSVHKSLTSGKLIQSGTFCLDHDVLQHQIKIERAKWEAAKEERKNKYEKKIKRKTKADLFRRTAIISKMTNQELSFLVTYKKVKTDADLPNARKATLLLRYAKTRNRPSPNITPYASDEDNEAEGVHIDAMNGIEILETPTPTAETAPQFNRPPPTQGDLMTTLVGAAQQIEGSNCEPPPDADTADALLIFDEDGDDVDDGVDL